MGTKLNLISLLHLLFIAICWQARKIFKRILLIRNKICICYTIICQLGQQFFHILNYSSDRPQAIKRNLQYTFYSILRLQEFESQIRPTRFPIVPQSLDINIFQSWNNHGSYEITSLQASEQYRQIEVCMITWRRGWYTLK